MFAIDQTTDLDGNVVFEVSTEGIAIAWFTQLNNACDFAELKERSDV